MNEMDDAARRDFWDKTNELIHDKLKGLNLTAVEDAFVDGLSHQVVQHVLHTFQQRHQQQPALREVVIAAVFAYGLLKADELIKYTS